MCFCIRILRVLMLTPQTEHSCLNCFTIHYNFKVYCRYEQVHKTAIYWPKVPTMSLILRTNNLFKCQKNQKCPRIGDPKDNHNTRLRTEPIYESGPMQPRLQRWLERQRKWPLSMVDDLFYPHWWPFTQWQSCRFSCSCSMASIQEFSFYSTQDHTKNLLLVPSYYPIGEKTFGCHGKLGIEPVPAA